MRKTVGLLTFHLSFLSAADALVWPATTVFLFNTSGAKGSLATLEINCATNDKSDTRFSALIKKGVGLHSNHNDRGRGCEVCSKFDDENG